MRKEPSCSAAPPGRSSAASPPSRCGSTTASGGRAPDAPRARRAPGAPGAEGSSDTWALWSLRWEGAEPGDHTVAVRATDGTGEVQTDERADPVPDGASGWRTVQFTVT